MSLPKSRTADGQMLPSKLKLAFSKAADNSRISNLFKPAIKSKLDPQNFVVKREQQIFDDTIARGGAAFLYDPATGEAHTLTMAYHVHDSAGHSFTEIGSSLARVTGFKSAQIVIAALVLKEWWQHKPADMVVTEILPGNGPSLHLYRDTMEWQPITDQKKVDKLHKLCNENISTEDQGRQTMWFACTNNVLPYMAEILLEYIDKGHLHNKRSGETIDLDLSMLSQMGLTRPRLEALARGITNKTMLAQQPPEPKV